MEITAVVSCVVPKKNIQAYACGKELMEEVVISLSVLTHSPNVILSKITKDDTIYTKTVCSNPHAMQSL